MRRRENPPDLETARTDPEDHRHRSRQSSTWWIRLVAMTVFAASISVLVRLKSVGFEDRVHKTEMMIYNRSLWDAREVLRDENHEPVYGLTTGAYRGMVPRSVPLFVAWYGMRFQFRHRFSLRGTRVRFPNMKPTFPFPLTPLAFQLFHQDCRQMQVRLNSAWVSQACACSVSLLLCKS